MPAKLFKTATKQLHEGYKAARERLSAGSSRQDSFSSSRGNASGNTSFNSISSDGKQRKVTMSNDVGGDLDNAVDDLTSTRKNYPRSQSKNSDRRFTTPPRTRSAASIFRDLYHSPDVATATQEVPKSTPTFPSLPGLSAFMSPKSAESTPSRTLASIAGMFSFKRSFDSQPGDSQSSLENIDENEKGSKTTEDTKG